MMMMMMMMIMTIFKEGGTEKANTRLIRVALNYYSLQLKK